MNELINLITLIGFNYIKTVNIPYELSYELYTIGTGQNIKRYKTIGPAKYDHAIHIRKLTTKEKENYKWAQKEGFVEPLGIEMFTFDFVTPTQAGESTKSFTILNQKILNTQLELLKEQFKNHIRDNSINLIINE